MLPSHAFETTSFLWEGGRTMLLPANVFLSIFNYVYVETTQNNNNKNLKINLLKVYVTKFIIGDYLITISYNLNIFSQFF